MGFLGFGQKNNVELFDRLVKEEKKDEIALHLDEDILRIQEKSRQELQRQIQVQRRIVQLGRLISATPDETKRAELEQELIRLKEIELKDVKKILDDYGNLGEIMRRIKDSILSSIDAAKEHLATLRTRL